MTQPHDGRPPPPATRPASSPPPPPLFTAPGGAWHPDPYGRAHNRYFDGAAWTERVANWGSEWIDAPGANPQLPDLTILAEPSLALSYGAVGIEGAGRWQIFDPTGHPRGTVVVETSGILGAGSRRYLVLDPMDRIVLVVDPRGGFSNDADLLDWTQRPHGVFDGQALSNVVRFVAGDMVYGQAAAVDGAGRSAPFVSDDVDHFQLTLTDHTGAAFGSLTNHEARRGLGSFFGGDPQPGQLLPEQSWFHLDRRPDLPEPLRTFTLAFPLLYAYRVHLTRAAARRRRHNRHH